MPVFKELKFILLLSLPIVANGLLESSNGFMNTFLVAHLGEAELAAAGLVSILFVALMVIFWGAISSVSIVISHYHGAENKPAIRGVLRDSLYLSIILAVPIMVLLWFAPDIFKWVGQSDFVVQESKKYLHALMWAIPFDLPGLALMQLFQGISKTRINFLFTLAYIPFLIMTNYIFMFGKFGMPALGLAGIGWGTMIAFAIFLIVMSLFIYYTPYYCDFANFKTASKKYYFGEIIKIGAPMGIMYGSEVGYFFVLALFMGKISQTVLGAHQITIQYFWIVMTVIFSLTQAFSIRLGWRLGRNEPEWIKPITQLAIRTTVIYSIIIGLCYWVFSRQLINFDFIHAPKPDAVLVNTAAMLFIYVGLFQLIDGMRIALFAILRAMKDTQFTLLTSIVAFWGIALPTGYYLAFVYKPNNPQGLWIGLILGAMVNIILLSLRLRSRLKYKIKIQ